MEEERKRHFERPTSVRPPSLLNLTLVAIFFGLVAGFFGYLFGKTIVPDSDFSYFNFTNPNNQIQLDLDQPLVNLYEKNTDSIAGLYRSVAINNSIGVPLFSETNFLGSAVVVTSDGWLMTTGQAYTGGQAKVVLGDRIYDIEETSQDDFTDLVFIKINANFLQPVNFQLTDEIKEGETLFSLIDSPNSIQHSFSVAILQNSHFVEEEYLFTDAVDYFFLVDNDTENKDLFSTPYFNTAGDLLGLGYNVGDNNLLIPGEYLKQAVKHLLSGSDRVSLGVRYVDMENNSGFIDKGGNLIYHPTLSALSTEAYQSGLRLGDRIVAVNNDVIASNKTLTSILQKYRVGDSVVFTVIRGEVELDVEIEL